VPATIALDDVVAIMAHSADRTWVVEVRARLEGEAQVSDTIIMRSSPFLPIESISTEGRDRIEYIDEPGGTQPCG